MDLDALVRPPAGSVSHYDQARVFEETGVNWLREVTPVNPAEPMRIMLVWTDAPGHGLGGTTPAWNNDLDLVVEAGGSTYRGNVFGADGWSALGGIADDKNNAEGVLFAVPPASVTLRVVASNVNSDGVPGVGDATDQDFALVCRNCAFAPGFDLDPLPVTADVCAPSPALWVVHPGAAVPRDRRELRHRVDGEDWHHGGLGRGDRHHRGDLHGEGPLRPHEFLRPRVVRAVHAVPRGRGG